MSECVVRMEMPKKCDECPAWCICGTLHKYMLGIDCDSDWTYDDLLVITVETGFVKPDNCPIICQLPEGHGRLIDVDAMAEDLNYDIELDAKALDDMSIVGYARERFQFDKNRKQDCIRYLSGQKIIVPAERREV